MLEIKGPVIPIPPAFDENENLDLKEIGKYLRFLQGYGIQNIMTTAGTTQFNLLSMEEIHQLNRFCFQNFNGNCILGLPPMSSRHLKEEMQQMCSKSVPDNVFPMILYPERHYSDLNIADFFKDIADFAERPIFIHGMWMRKGSGGFADISAEVINDIASHPNIVGMKEETMDLSKAYGVLSQITDKSFITIVAGGSMRRWQFLKSAGATTFLGGIGNLFPKVEIDFFNNHTNEEIAGKCLELESILFNQFMHYGWHKSLRYGLTKLDLMNAGARKPFPGEFDEYAQAYINLALKEIKQKIEEETDV